MTADRALLTSPDVPEPVLAVLREAVVAGLLDDADSLAAGLERAGWRRGRSGGRWTCPSHPGWSVQSAEHPPSLSVFADGEHEVVAGASTRLARHLGSGGTGRPLDHELDPDRLDWPRWTTADVEVSLHLSPFPAPLPLPDHLEALAAPCSLQLAVQRTDAPPEGLPWDHERALRVARHGSPVARWYLAAQDDLTDDVVEVLRNDEDPAVVAALDDGASQRRVLREDEAEQRGERGPATYLVPAEGGPGLTLVGTGLAEVVALYRAVGWSAYADDPALLSAALTGSARVVVARRGEQLAGLARVISDGASIAYLQDLLVHPDHQRCGVGTALVREALRPFAGVRQQVLLTDDEPGQRAFYASLGFTQVGEEPCGSLRSFVRFNA
ncbi:GNAT family N-acetyltransferase [Quadrisphaera setariae]|uniref:GNAT family N-acetyltransferase n=1 Tax=Quadrisphaera setariae TaxID=2593304 RepID=A0A5C8Z426_9ACTN|nr:GNAT family N-acetyltransferase [Quadrisphaera setariae]TXR51666.1 GNAT family N-acetyltransferase [Quadrisphaera setariae]